jgi:hypothetical protein
MPSQVPSENIPVCMLENPFKTALGRCGLGSGIARVMGREIESSIQMDGT